MTRQDLGPTTPEAFAHIMVIEELFHTLQQRLQALLEHRNARGDGGRLGAFGVQTYALYTHTHTV